MKNGIKPRLKKFKVFNSRDSFSLTVDAVTLGHAIGCFIKATKVKRPPFIYQYKKQYGSNAFHVEYFILTWKRPDRVAGHLYLNVEEL